MPTTRSAVQLAVQAAVQQVLLPSASGATAYTLNAIGNVTVEGSTTRTFSGQKLASQAWAGRVSGSWSGPTTRFRSQAAYRRHGYPQGQIAENLDCRYTTVSHKLPSEEDELREPDA